MYFMVFPIGCAGHRAGHDNDVRGVAISTANATIAREAGQWQHHALDGKALEPCHAPRACST
jgi:hypothetical protein